MKAGLLVSQATDFKTIQKAYVEFQVVVRASLYYPFKIKKVIVRLRDKRATRKKAALVREISRRQLNEGRKQASRSYCITSKT